MSIFSSDVIVAIICGLCLGVVLGSGLVLAAVWLDREFAREREKQRIIKEVWDEMKIVWKE